MIEAFRHVNNLGKAPDGPRGPAEYSLTLCRRALDMKVGCDGGDRMGFMLISWSGSRAVDGRETRHVVSEGGPATLPQAL